MEEFVIEGSIHQHKSVKIKAKDRDSAVKKFKKRFTNYDVESCNDKYAVGTCENTGKTIFEGDDYYSDSEGIMWLKESSQ